ncbi:protein aspartic protease in guard cell 2 [Quercus suber]|uniref:Protein aspartic protease in guard cell 2 n=1 Tax=Quercus suber TaxID=58331 RepID=A0AAW0JN85_QUESU
MKRDARRVANLIHQLDEDGVYYPGMERFKEDISSDLGSREYFTPVGLGTPPTLQYLVINIGSDVGAGLVCVSTSGTFGSLVLGREGIPTCAAWASLLSNKQAPSFYYIELVGLGAESIRLPISEDVFQISKSGHGGVIMDMGTKTSHVGIHSRSSTYEPNVPLVETQTNPIDERKSWKLEVVHRDRIHPSSFQQHMKRDAKMVANHIHQLDEDGVYYPEVKRFKEDVGSELESGEYFIQVGLGTLPTPQYLAIDIGSDIVDSAQPMSLPMSIAKY